jgi:hypothetical protein
METFKLNRKNPVAGLVQMQPFAQATFERDVKTVTDSQHWNHQFQVNRWPVYVTITPNKMSLTHKLSYSTEQMIGGRIIFNMEDLQQRRTTDILTSRHGEKSNQ